MTSEAFEDLARAGNVEIPLRRRRRRRMFTVI
jgi:hypothetical protein